MTLRATQVVILVLSVGALTACSSDSIYSGHFPAFGGQVDVTIVGVPRHEAQQAIDALAEDFDYMEQAWRTPSAGALGRTNQLLATGERFSASPSVLPLVKKGQQLTAASGGLLNSALGGLLRLWGFYRSDVENFQPPDDAAIADLLARNPSMDDITVDGFHLRATNPAVALDFSGFLKGYAIDQAIAHLRERGIDNAMLNAGGDLRAIGSRARHPWRAAVRRPDGTGVMAMIDLEDDESVVTVGAYERYLTWQGTHYHYILDPSTGRPADRTQSVTVVHPQATIAHAAATALFIAGPDAWPAVAARMGIDQAMLVATDGVHHITPGLESRLHFLAKKPVARIVVPTARDDGAT